MQQHHPFAIYFESKTEFASGLGRRDTCHFSDLDETWPD